MFDDRQKLRASACVIGIALIGLADLLTANLNFAMFYPLALICFRWLGLKRGAWAPLAGALIGLSYLGYFAGPWPPEVADRWSAMWGNYRLVNRTLVAVVIGALAILAPRPGEVDADGEPSPSDEGLAMGVLCVIMSLGIFLADLLTPASQNWAIFYAVPILLSPATRARRWMYLLLPLFVAMVWLGLYADTESWRVPVTPPMVYARSLVSLALIGAWVMHFIGIGRRVPGPRELLGPDRWPPAEKLGQMAIVAMALAAAVSLHLLTGMSWLLAGLLSVPIAWLAVCIMAGTVIHVLDAATGRSWGSDS